MIDQDYHLKYQIALEALEILDAATSFALVGHNGKDLSRQTVKISDIRSCHNKLIITFKDSKLLDIFLQIIFRSTDHPIPHTDLLNEFRNLIRLELGLERINLDRNKAFIGSLACESNSKFYKQK